MLDNKLSYSWAVCSFTKKPNANFLKDYCLTIIWRHFVAKLRTIGID